jgi:hypothetical protein
MDFENRLVVTNACDDSRRGGSDEERARAEAADDGIARASFEAAPQLASEASVCASNGQPLED